MALTKILNKVSLNTWYETNIENFNYCNIVVKKETKAASDIVDSSKIVRVAIGLGADSGVAGHPIIIQRINLSFNDADYGDPVIDKQVIFAQLKNIPSSFYIKVLSVDDGKKPYTSGDVSLSISTEGVKLA